MRDPRPAEMNGPQPSLGRTPSPNLGFRTSTLGPPHVRRLLASDAVRRNAARWRHVSLLATRQHPTRMLTLSELAKGRSSNLRSVEGSPTTASVSPLKCIITQRLFCKSFRVNNLRNCYFASPLELQTCATRGGWGVPPRQSLSIQYVTILSASTTLPGRSLH